LHVLEVQMQAAMSLKKSALPAEQYVTAQQVCTQVEFSVDEPSSALKHFSWLAAVQLPTPPPLELPEELPLDEPLLLPLLEPLELPEELPLDEPLLEPLDEPLLLPLLEPLDEPLLLPLLEPLDEPLLLPLLLPELLVLDPLLLPELLVLDPLLLPELLVLDPLELPDEVDEPLLEPLDEPLLEPLPLLELLGPGPPTHTGTVVDVPFGADGWHVVPPGQSCDESQNERHWPPMQISFEPHDGVPCVSSHAEPAEPGPALRQA
jgi:hypothetical protein